jgi:hypothetical protein
MSTAEQDRVLAITTRHVGACRLAGRWCRTHQALAPGRLAVCEWFGDALSLAQAVADDMADRVSGPSLAEWAAAGQVRGFVVGPEPIVCATHAGIPYTEAEEALIEAEDGDRGVVCAWIVRVAP